MKVSCQQNWHFKVAYDNVSNGRSTFFYGVQLYGQYIVEFYLLCDKKGVTAYKIEMINQMQILMQY